MKKNAGNINSARVFLLVFLYFIITSAVAQNKTDSLINLIRTSKEDSTKVNAFNELAWEYAFTVPDSALFLSNRALQLSDKIGWLKGRARSFHNIAGFYFLKGEYEPSINVFKQALNEWNKLIDQSSGQLRLYYQKQFNTSYGNMGNNYLKLGNFAKALEHYLIALENDEKFKNKNGIGRHLNNISQVYKHQGNLPKALEYLFRALKLFEENNKKEACSSALGNIGSIYSDMKEYGKALDYFQRSVNIDEELGKTSGVAIQLGNMGRVYLNQGNYEKALEYYTKAAKLSAEVGDKDGSARNTGNTGLVFYKQNNLQKALQYFETAYKEYEQIGDKEAQAIWLLNIGVAHTGLKNYSKAESFLKNSLDLSNEINSLENIQECHQNLSALYSSTGRDGMALTHYKKYIQARDSLFNAENTKKAVRAEMNFEFEKKEQAAKLEQEKKDALALIEKKKQEAENQRQLIIIWSVAGILAIVILFSILLYNRFKITKSQKNIIEIQKNEAENQKSLIEEKQKEILDSINYAKRLQSAILPTNDYINKYFPDNFVLYRPKDIVAGDFYWLEHADDTTFVAVADSTGHGVPGALVSVVCSNALNRAVMEFGLREPGKILDKTRDLVLETFIKGSEDVKDGMDISMLAVEHKTKKVMWSGANNHLWYTIKENDEVKLIELGPDKQPIGKTENPKPFTTRIIDYSPGTMFYLLTDGYADQFGGEKGKKFKHRQLASLISSICNLPPKEQHAPILNSFLNWKGENEQVDDVTIIGVQMNA